MDEIIILFLLSDLKPGMYFKIDLILINLMPPFMFIITEKGIKSMNYIKRNEEEDGKLRKDCKPFIKAL